MTSDEAARAAAGFQVLAKPIGPACNLSCRYCYYLEKEQLYPGTKNFRMSDEVLESFVRQYIAALSGPQSGEMRAADIPFAWQGGEPLLLGVEFFRRVVELQKKYCPAGRRAGNAIQTNGTLLDDEWCAFFRENGFLVGISLDGPKPLHDQYRVDKGGAPTFDRAMQGLDLLRRHGVEFNTLTVVQRQNARQPLEVYRFLKQHGSRFMQFIPLVERSSGTAFQAVGVHGRDAPATVAPWSVEAGAFGEFLCAIFDEWVRHDVGDVYVQLFEVQVALTLGLPSSLCVFAETCGRGLALEHNGDLYACDHYVYPQYKLGNILQTPLVELVDLPQQMAFGAAKRDALNAQCRSCPTLRLCQGECPKHRLVAAPDGSPGLNYLCAGYKWFFKHSAPYLARIAELVRAQRPAANIMLELARKERAKKGFRV